MLIENLIPQMTTTQSPTRPNPPKTPKISEITQIPTYLNTYNLEECLEELHLSSAYNKLQSHGISTMGELYPIIWNLVRVIQHKTSLSLTEIIIILKMFDLISFGKGTYMNGDNNFRKAKIHCETDEYWKEKKVNNVRGHIMCYPDKYINTMKLYTGVYPKYEKLRLLVMLKHSLMKPPIVYNNNSQKGAAPPPTDNTSYNLGLVGGIRVLGKQPKFIDVYDYDLSLPQDVRIEKYCNSLHQCHQRPEFAKNSYPLAFKVDVIDYMDNNTNISHQIIGTKFMLPKHTIKGWHRDRISLRLKLFKQKEQETEKYRGETPPEPPNQEILRNRDHIKPSVEFKLEVIKYLEWPHTTHETAEFCQVSSSSVIRWLKEKDELLKERNAQTSRREKINRRMYSKVQNMSVTTKTPERYNLKFEEGKEGMSSLQNQTSEYIGNQASEGDSQVNTGKEGNQLPETEIPTHNLYFIPHHCLKEEPIEEHEPTTPNNIDTESICSDMKDEGNGVKDEIVDSNTQKSTKKRHVNMGGKENPNNNLTIEKRWFIIFVKKYLWEYEFSFQEIAFMLNTSLSTAMSYWNFYEKYGTLDISKNPKTYKWKPDETICEAIEQYMEDKNKKGEMPIARDIMFHLKDLGFPPITHDKLRRMYLRKIGYSFKRVHPTIANKENRSNQTMRSTYLENLMSNRALPEEQRLEEVFLDESYVKDIHHRSNCWVKKNELNTIILPKSNHQMVCIVAAINYQGWTGVNYPEIKDQLRLSCKKGVYKYGSIKYFKYENLDESDYHHSFTIPFFSDYFENDLLPGLTAPSILIMDRVSYHVHLVGSAVEIRKATRQELVESLLGKDIKFSKQDKIEDLRKMLMKEAGNTTFCEEKAKASKHRVLYLPPYHPEFNPIEQAWGFIKRRVGSNPKYNIQYICEEQLPDAFTEFVGARAYNLIRHTDGILQATIGDPHLRLPKKTVKYSRKEDATFIDRISPDCLIWGTFKD